jgi:hypothetical protein
VTEGPHRRALSYNLIGSGDLHPECWKYAPVVQHDVTRDGANVQLLLERWGNGGHVADCFPNGLAASLAEVFRLRAYWADRFPSNDFACSFADWMEIKLREEYAPPARVRPSRNHRFRRTKLRRRRSRTAGENRERERGR